MESSLRLSAGMVVIRCFAEEPRYLLLRAYRYWDFPKGLLEPGEAPLTAAKREVAEETGLCELRFPWGEIYRETPVYNRGKVARYYLAEAPEGEVFLPVSPELGRPEHDEFRWLPYGAARALLGARLQDILDWAAGLAADHCTGKRPNGDFPLLSKHPKNSWPSVIKT